MRKKRKENSYRPRFPDRAIPFKSHRPRQSSQLPRPHPGFTA